MGLVLFTSIKMVKYTLWHIPHHLIATSERAGLAVLCCFPFSTYIDLSLYL